MSERHANIRRQTLETEIELSLVLDGEGAANINTGLGFLDHMLITLTKHSGIDLMLTCKGDLHVDDHHTVEDCALVLGAGIDQALGDRKGIVRFGSAYAPLDEALARSVIDFSGRPSWSVELCCSRELLGTVATENFPHFFQSFATSARATLHVDVLKGSNDHHRVESAFKSLALALRQAVTRTASQAIPSTKGVL